MEGDESNKRHQPKEKQEARGVGVGKESELCLAYICQKKIVYMGPFELGVVWRLSSFSSTFVWALGSDTLISPHLFGDLLVLSVLSVSSGYLFLSCAKKAKKGSVYQVFYYCRRIHLFYQAGIVCLV
ncbi:hypothetical protein QBC36DRAFT_334467 [Triangularia setosa]|uniref:Uncharacterized protein n=1 Tax=Triangularia setosa TaxID=2587417 RepID=A0AAN6W273_9PEZI|nr:hypothetical protein QBC36DRAFT_334467 [Podospora setosa]